jgi:hypothetical protein
VISLILRAVGERLRKRFEAIPRAVRDAVQPALKASGQQLTDAMKALAEPSRDTGELIDSIIPFTRGFSAHGTTYAAARIDGYYCSFKANVPFIKDGNKILGY